MQRYKKSPKWGKKCCKAWSCRTSATGGVTEGDSTGCVAKNGGFDAPQALSATVNQESALIARCSYIVLCWYQLFPKSYPTPCQLHVISGHGGRW